MRTDACKIHVRNNLTHDGDIHFTEKVKGNIAHKIHLSVYDKFRIWFDPKFPKLSSVVFPVKIPHV